MTDRKNVRPYAQVIEKLKQVHLRPTRQRLALAKCLFNGPNRHVTAEMLHGEAIKANIKISLATVYNTLHQFTDAGLLRQVQVGTGQTYFDTNLTDHHHYFMAENATLEDVPAGVIMLNSLPPVPKGKKLDHIDVIIHVTNND